MMRRTLANMANFYTEQLAVDVREGHERRVQEGWFVSRVPYGYRNARHNGRGVVEVDPAAGPNVRRIFQLFAYEPLTLDALIERLERDGVVYRPAAAKFPRSTLHRLLRERSYIGEVEFRGAWYPGKHEPLVDRGTWDRVQAILGAGVYRAHEMTYASVFIRCGCCGHPITGERKINRTKSGERSYVYYRCSRYNSDGHIRIRVTEAELDRQMLAVFDSMRIKDSAVQDWFRTVLASQVRDTQADCRAQRQELQRQSSLLVAQQDRLLNLRLADDLDQETFARKQTELRDRLASIKLQLDVLDRSHDETASLAAKVFELSQTLQITWVSADYATKRRILEIVYLNCTLDGVSLVPVMRKPFDVLAEGPFVPQNWGSRI